jgi:hypothetical protein
LSAVPTCCASPAGGSMRLRARTTASRIRRMAPRWRMAGASLAERSDRHQSGDCTRDTESAGQSRSASRLMTATAD